MLLGYPLFADPNQQLWYPLAWLHVLPQTLQRVCRRAVYLGRERHGGIRSCVDPIYARGGRFRTRIRARRIYDLARGHLMLTHPAAWAPFVLWGLESMRRGGGGIPRNRYLGRRSLEGSELETAMWI